MRKMFSYNRKMYYLTLLKAVNEKKERKKEIAKWYPMIG